MLTDSGGFQVFSLASLNAISELGVTFKSPRDGLVVELTPERVMAIQNSLGADVAMAFDQCPPYPASHADVQEATERTHRWLERCVAAHNCANQALFGIVQGGCYEDLRKESARVVAGFNLPGVAIGGVSVGEPALAMHEVVRWVAPLLPLHKPRYLMGVGTLPEMAQAVAEGVDLFDCVLPTRLGRHGAALVGGERWNLKNARFRNDHSPLDSTCPCPTCQQHSRAYLHHLIKSDEILGLTLLSLHNLSQLLRFTIAMAMAIRDGCFAEHFAPWEPGSAAAHTW
jgi:queuine tRNA-ribosyltransferase